jgi:hypothetical protein
MNVFVTAGFAQETDLGLLGRPPRNMMPRILTDWTKDRLIGLLDQGIFEPESFDFKEFRIGKKSDQEKQNIRTDCCAFANSFGGFLVYGVADDKR